MGRVHYVTVRRGFSASRSTLHSNTRKGRRQARRWRSDRAHVIPLAIPLALSVQYLPDVLHSSGSSDPQCTRSVSTPEHVALEFGHSLAAWPGCDRLVYGSGTAAGATKLGPALRGGRGSPMAALRFATDIPDIAWTNRALPSTSLDFPALPDNGQTRACGRRAKWKTIVHRCGGMRRSRRALVSFKN